MQSHNNSIDGEYNGSLVTPKTCDKIEAQAAKKNVFCWRKEDPPVFEKHHEEAFTEKPIEVGTLYKYFKQFFTNDLLRLVVDNTNLYSTQKPGKSINITGDEMSIFIKMEFMMGSVKLPTLSDYWSNAMRYPAIISNMPRNRFKVLCQNLHFVDDSSFSEENGKLFKILPIIGAVRTQC